LEKKKTTRTNSCSFSFTQFIGQCLLFCVSGSYIVVILLFFHCRPFLCLLLFLFFLSGFVIRYDVFQRPYGKGFFPFEAFKIDLFDELRQGRFPSFLFVVVNFSQLVGV